MFFKDTICTDNLQKELSLGCTWIKPDAQVHALTEKVEDVRPADVLRQVSRDGQGDHRAEVAAREGDRRQAAAFKRRRPAAPHGVDARISHALKRNAKRVTDCSRVLRALR